METKVKNDCYGSVGDVSASQMREARMSTMNQSVRGRVASLVLIACSIPEAALSRDRGDAMLACSQVNQEAKINSLSKMPDFEIEHSLCLMSKLAGEAISAKDTAAEVLCMESVEALVREFKRRWPNRKAGEVFRAC